MLKCFISGSYRNGISLLSFLFFLHHFTFAQNFQISGVVKDQKTLKFLQAVNIRVSGTVQGTSTDISGNFSLVLTSIPAKLIITCLGYENAYYDVNERKTEPVEILLRPIAYSLGQVDISSNKYSFLFKDKDYSILDYELMDSNLLLLVMRYQLKHSELVLLTRNADTLVVSKLQQGRPGSLFKDFLSKVHYFSKDEDSYQCYFNNYRGTIDLLFKTTVDSTINRLSPFIFRISDRLYFQENVANGFGTNIGYYDMATGKKYIRKFFDEKKLAKYSKDRKSYSSSAFADPSRRNSHRSLPKLSRGSPGAILPYYDNFYTDPEFDFGSAVIDHSLIGRIDFYKMIYPVIKTREDNIAFLNFSNDLIELMDSNGTLLDTIPISFHKKVLPQEESSPADQFSNAGWLWSWNIITDDYTADVYTTFKRNGMVMIRRIDLETGKLHNGTVLPYPFPEKIKIYKGEAFYLVKRDGTSDNWKLMKSIL